MPVKWGGGKTATVKALAIATGVSRFPPLNSRFRASSIDIPPGVIIISHTSSRLSFARQSPKK